MPAPLCRLRLHLDDVVPGSLFHSGLGFRLAAKSNPLQKLSRGLEIQSIIVIVCTVLFCQESLTRDWGGLHLNYSGQTWRLVGGENRGNWSKWGNFFFLALLLFQTQFSNNMTTVWVAMNRISSKHSTLFDDGRLPSLWQIDLLYFHNRSTSTSIWLHSEDLM